MCLCWKFFKEFGDLNLFAKMPRKKRDNQTFNQQMDEKEGLKGIKLQKLGESSSSGAFIECDMITSIPVPHDNPVYDVSRDSPILIDEEANKGKKLVIK